MKIKILAFLGFIILNTASTFGQTVVINEIMSDNQSTLEDMDGDFSDWIELYNTTENSINLLNFGLSDKDDLPLKWIFPAVEIPSHGFITLFASGKEIYNISELHTNFKISKNGEKLYLSNTEGTVISTMPSIALSPDYSYGCFPDGTNNQTLFNEPTPNSSNSSTSQTTLSASHPSGYYESPIELSLFATDPTCKIFYTFNGNSPTTDDRLYSSPVSINPETTPITLYSSIPTTPLEGPDQLQDYIWKESELPYSARIIRYAGFIDGEQETKVYSKTYFIDPEIENRYTFPVVSLITDSLNLFGHDTGIYIPGRVYDEIGWSWWPEGNYHNRGREWEKPIHFTLFNTNGSVNFETDAGMRMRGYGSTCYPQKSFCVYLRSEYGISSYNDALFENDTVDYYKRIIFRNSGNDLLYAHLRDALLQEMIKGMDLELQDYQPSVVFINGQYWGIHDIREKYDKHYFEGHFGIEEDNINLISVCGVVEEEGSSADFNTLITFLNANDISDPTNYATVESMLDISNVIDYEIAEIYFANVDWPCNNYKMWKSNDPDSKWRFMLYDLDLSSGFSSDADFSTPSMEWATTVESGWPHCGCSSLIFRKLLENEEFKELFIDRFVYHLFNTFQRSRLIDLIDAFETQLYPEMSEHIARWGYPNSIDSWKQEVEKLREFAENRPCYMRSNLMSFFELDTLPFNCDESIHNYENQPLTISPNPSNGSLIFSNTISTPFNGSFALTNSLGATVYHNNNLSLRGQGKAFFNINWLPNGLYIVRYWDGTHSMSQKLVISK